MFVPAIVRPEPLANTTKDVHFGAEVLNNPLNREEGY